MVISCTMKIKTPEYLTRWPESKVIASVSGGKDSTAMAVWLLRESGIPRDRIGFVFADTGWEHPDTYAYLDYLDEALGMELVQVKGEFTMVSLCEKKKRFPSPLARFCTSELKVKPIAAYLDNLDCDPINAVGIRADESPGRARMPEWEENHNYPYDAPIWRPLILQTAKDCFDLCDKYGVRHNPLYLRGANRVGCYPCIFARKSELREIFIQSPETLDKLVKAEAAVSRCSPRGDSSFFAPRKVPPSLHDKVYTDPETGVSTTFASAKAVRLWALDGDQPELDFGDEPPACWSQYGLCE